jgi:flagellar hook assembly protein FlgD
MVTSVHAQTIITNVNVQGFAISPNGDGVSDDTTISATIADSATTVFIAVFRMDTTTVVDTLFVGQTTTDAATVTGTWDGRDFNGSPVADDSFLVCVRADNGPLQEAQYRAITVDRVAPQIVITNLFPFDFGPGSPDPLSDRLTIEFLLTDAFPSQGARVTVDILPPTGSSIAALRTSNDLPLDSTYTDTWDGSTATRDGIHTVAIVATDQAGNSTTQNATVNVDLDEPEIRFTDPPTNQALNVPPDSLRGWAYDRTGLRPLEYAIAPNTIFAPVPSFRTRDDTLFFSVPVADSIGGLGDGESRFDFTVVDLLGREAQSNTRTWLITIDTNAPIAPTLKQPTSPTTNPRAIVEAEFDRVDTRELVIFNNGTEVGSEVVLGSNSNTAFLPVTLSPGTNRITALARDFAGNESAQSAPVIVEFDSDAALNFPTPFVPNDEFQLNFMRDVALIRLTVYDLAGNVVERLRSNRLGRTFTLIWDGNNGNGEPVKRGPLVVVLEVTFPDGEKKVHRQGMLFTPVPEQ